MIKVAIIGLGIMGRRMLQHMRIHETFAPNYLWDPDENACQKAMEIDSEAKIMTSPEDAIDAADSPEQVPRAKEKQIDQATLRRSSYI